MEEHETESPKLLVFELVLGGYAAAVPGQSALIEMGQNEGTVLIYILRGVKGHL